MGWGLIAGWIIAGAAASLLQAVWLFLWLVFFINVANALVGLREKKFLRTLSIAGFVIAGIGLGVLHLGTIGCVATTIAATFEK